MADGKLCPMVVTDNSQRSERQGGLANGCVTVLNQERTLIEMGGLVKKLLFHHQENECLSHRIGRLFVQ